MYPAGALFKTASGDEGMLTSVVVGSSYVDPGASASDERSADPGVLVDVTSSIITGGLNDIVTTAPTPTSAPFVVT